MDIKHRTAYLRIKQFGVAEETVFNDGESIVVLLGKLLRHLGGAPNRYGRVTIELDFTPFGQSMTQQEKDYAELLSKLDLTGIEMETDEEAAIWESNPRNPENPDYDALYHEYQNCGVSSHRQIKTPEDLAILRKHVESKYANTRWWDGSHRW